MLTSDLLAVPACRHEWAVKDSNLRSLLTTDLQSVPFGHLGNCPYIDFYWLTLLWSDQRFLAKPTTRIELVTARLQGGCSAD